MSNFQRNIRSDAPAASPGDELDPRNWVDLHGAYLQRYAVSMIGNPAEAEEVVQETFVSGIRALDSFEGRGSVRAWLRGILKNKVIDRIRAQKRQPTIALDSENGDPDQFNRLGIWKNILQRWDGTPDEVLEQRDFMGAFSKCLHALPDQMRLALVMKTFDGAKTEEVCRDLDVTSANLWVLIHRARLRLRDCLQKSWFST